MGAYRSIRSPGRCSVGTIALPPSDITHVLLMDQFLDSCFVSAWETHLTIVKSFMGSTMYNIFTVLKLLL